MFKQSILLPSTGKAQTWTTNVSLSQLNVEPSSPGHLLPYTETKTGMTSKRSPSIRMKQSILPRLPFLIYTWPISYFFLNLSDLRIPSFISPTFESTRGAFKGASKPSYVHPILTPFDSKIEIMLQEIAPASLVFHFRSFLGATCTLVLSWARKNKD